MTVARVRKSRFQRCEFAISGKREREREKKRALTIHSQLFARAFLAGSIDPRVRRPVSVSGGSQVCFGFKTRPTGQRPLRRNFSPLSLPGTLRLPFLPHPPPPFCPPSHHDSFPFCFARVALRLREPISVNLRYEPISLALTHTIARERTHAFVARRDVGSFEDKGGGRYFGTFDVSLELRFVFRHGRWMNYFLYGELD